MKKLFIAIALFGSLAIHAQSKGKTSKVRNTSEAASQTKLSPETMAKKDVDALKSAILLDESKSSNAMHLFKIKHETLNNPSLSAEDKAMTIKSLDKRFEVLLGQENYSKFKSNKDLYGRLMN